MGKIRDFGDSVVYSGVVRLGLLPSAVRDLEERLTRLEDKINLIAFTVSRGAFDWRGEEHG